MSDTIEIDKPETLIVRVGTPDDVHDIMELGQMACAENGFVNVNPTKLLDDIWQALNQNHGLMGIVGPEEGKPQGAVLLRITMPWYSDDAILEERAIFIHPDYRAAKGGRASRMVEFSKRVADRMNMPLMIGVLSHQRTEAKVRMYKRHFGEPAGAYWLYNARTGSPGS